MPNWNFPRGLKRRCQTGFISNEGPFHPGQTVYYKRQNKDKWFDPARVLALKIIIVRHGGQLYRAHSIHVRRSPTEDPFLRLEHDDRSEKPSRDRPGVPINPGEKFLDAHETSNPDGSSSEITNGSTNVDSLVCQNNQACLEDGAESDSRDKPATQTVLEVVKTVSTSNASDIKPGKVIRYYHGDAEETAEARVLSRAGKANEKHCHWFNIEYLKPEDLLGTRGSFDVSKSVENVSESEIALITDNTFVTNESDEFIAEKLSELQNWLRFDVYEVVENTGQKVITARWVCTSKDGLKKARLVAKGYQDADIETLV